MSPALRLVCACCRWPDGRERLQAIRHAAGKVEDWCELTSLAAEHRVEGLVAKGIAAVASDVPDWVAAHFGSVAARVKARALQDLAETLRVGEAMERTGISYAILKGVPLGIQAFGTPLLKQSWDIDLFVDRKNAVAAAGELTALGYRTFLPPRPLTHAELERWSNVSKEAEFRAGDRAVELHWGLVDHPMLLAGLGIAEADRRIGLIGGRAVPVLNDAANLAYLAVHGASHGWSRLKWLADFAAFLTAVHETERERLLAQARRWKTGFAIDQALHLSNRLFASSFPQSSAGKSVATLIRLGETVIARRGPATDFDSDPVAGPAIAQAKRILIPNRRYRFQLMLQRIRGSEDRRQFPLPRALEWLYWPMRPFTAAYRVVQRRICATGTKNSSQD